MWAGSYQVPYESAGGTTHPLSISGALTPAGSLVRQPQKGIAGALTSSGALVRSTLKPLAGSLTPTGSLDAVRVVALVISGSITPTGSLVKSVAKDLSGSVASAGVLVRDVAKSISGRLFTQGHSGVVIASGTAQLVQQSAFPPNYWGLRDDDVNFPAAGVVEGDVIEVANGVTDRILFTATTSVSFLDNSSTSRWASVPDDTTYVVYRGSVKLTVGKGIAGAITPAGALGVVKVVVLSIGGTLTMSGSLVKDVAKTVTGAVAPTGAVTKRAAKAVGGTLASAGAVTRLTAKSLAGTLSSAGSLGTSVLAIASRGVISVAGRFAKAVSTAGRYAKDIVTPGEQ